jgi:hypothetical protein
VSSLVLELQRDALDRTIPETDLLRKALVVARKLGLPDLEAWIGRELGGYSLEDEVPAYREFRGEVKALNPFRGWIPVTFDGNDEGESLKRRKVRQPIASLCSLLEAGPDSPLLQMPIPESIQRQICGGGPLDTVVTTFIARSTVAAALDAVRNTILNWSLKLEEDGILGEGLTFTAVEKKDAASHSYNVNNFFGDVTNPQVQQGAPHSVQVLTAFTVDSDALGSFLVEFRRQLDSLSLSPEALAEAEAELETLEAQRRSPKPKSPIVRDGLKSLRSLLENAGGSVAAQLLIELGKLLGGG